MSWIDRAGTALVEPAPVIQSTEKRVRARLHSALLLVLIVGGTLALVYEAFAETDPYSGTFILAASSIGLLIALYALSRTRHYNAAAALTVLVVSTAVWRFWAMEAPRDGGPATLYYLALPLILAAVLLPLWFTLVFTALTIASVALIPLYHESMGIPPPEDGIVTDLVIYVVLVSAVAWVAAQQLEQARLALAAQTRQVEQVNAKLRAVEDNRRRMLHQVAHDLGSPLTPIRLQLALLKRADETSRDKALAVLDRNVLKLQHLVEDIKDLSHIEEGQLRLDVKAGDLAALVQDVCETFKPRAQELGIELQCQLTGSIGALMDSQRISQVVTNLISNAIKFTPQGGTVTAAVSRNGEWAEVRVTDSGRGLEAAETARLFQPFSQVHAPGESRERGSGLGLYISKGFLERQGGSIAVSSPGRGQGTTFTFRLPLSPM